MAQQVTDNNGNPTGKWYDPSGSGLYLNYDPDAVATPTPSNDWWTNAPYINGTPYKLNPNTGQPELIGMAKIPAYIGANGQQIYRGEQVPESVARSMGASFQPYTLDQFKAPKNDFDIGGALLGLGATAMTGLGGASSLANLFGGGLLGNAGSGALISGLTGGDPLKGAITGGIGGAIGGSTGSLYNGDALAAGEAATTGLGSLITPDALGAAQTVYSTGSPLVSPALETAMNSPGGNMNYFDDLLGLTDSVDMTGFYTPSDSLNLSSGIDNSAWNLGTGSGDLTASGLDSTLPNTGVVPNGYTVDLSNSGNLIPTGSGSVDILGQLKSILNGYKTATGALGATGSKPSLGSSVMNQITNDPLQAAFNATPFLLALQQANSQGGDLKSTLNKIQGLADGVSGNSNALTTAVLNPYDQATATGLGNLTQSLGSRGVFGSSFGDMSLDNYNYTRDMGRGDLLAKTKLASTGLEADLLSKVLSGQNTANTNKNLLLGAGLSASGRLFQPETDPFGLKALLGA